MDVLNEPRLVFTLVIATNRLCSRPGLCSHYIPGAGADAWCDSGTTTPAGARMFARYANRDYNLVQWTCSFCKDEEEKPVRVG